MTGEKSEPVNVFSRAFRGGPKNVGDPNDETLRHVEEFVYVNNIVQERAHREKCVDVIKTWGQCMEAHKEGWASYMTWYTCNPQVKIMNTCLRHYYTDPDFKEECKQMYLAKRKHFRETGVVEKMPTNRKPYYESAAKQEFRAEFYKNKENQANEKNKTNNS
jgi:COX assembly protein 1